METSPSGSIVGLTNNFVTINCCPTMDTISQLSILYMVSGQNTPTTQK